MSRPDCTHAATNPDWGGYHAHCHGCKVRALASGPQFWRSLTDRQRTPGYQGELEAVFGVEGAEAGHKEVFAEYRRLALARKGEET